MNDIVEYTKNENFKYLIIKASHGNYFGFNLRVKMERTYAMKIVSPNEPDNFMIVGWKVTKKFPMWVGNANSWIDFINRKDEEEEDEKEEEEEDDKEEEEDKEVEEEDKEKEEKEEEYEEEEGEEEEEEEEGEVEEEEEEDEEDEEEEE